MSRHNNNISNSSGRGTIMTNNVSSTTNNNISNNYNSISTHNNSPIM